MIGHLSLPLQTYIRLVRGGISGTLGVIYNPQFLYTPLPGPLIYLPGFGVCSHVTLTVNLT